MNLSGKYAVLIVINPDDEYYQYRQDSDVTWFHKPSSTKIIKGVKNPKED